VWILPVDLSQVRLALPPGQHLLPWHYTDEEVQRLAWLLRGLLPDIKEELHLNDATLRVVSSRRIQARDALVVAKVEGSQAELDDALERLRGLHARYALLHSPVPQEAGYAWLEQHVKVPVLSVLRTWLRRADHPLAPLNIQHLPVLEAAALTTDPVELLELLERTVSHRIHHLDVGVAEDDYLRSLYVCAGRRLVERLGRLPAASPGVPEALEVILAGATSSAEETRRSAGEEALQRVGLAQVVAGSVSLGPLARSVAEPRLLGALEAGLPEGAWTAESRALVRSLRGNQEIALPDIPAGMTVEMSAPGNAPLPVELLREPVRRAFAGHADAATALDLLTEVATLPWYQDALPREIDERLSRVLAWLEEAQRAVSEEERWMARALEGLLRLFAARGPAAVEQQAHGLALLDEALDHLAEPWTPRISAPAMLHHAGFRLDRARSREDLDRAETLLVQCVKEWEGKVDPAARRLLAAAYLRLGDLAVVRDERERALEWDEKARLSVQGTVDGPLLMDIEWALARDMLGEGRLDEAEQHALQARAASERIHDLWRFAASSRLLAELKLERKDLVAAGDLAEEALSAADPIGDLKGKVESLLILALVAMRRGENEVGRTRAEEIVRLSEAADWPWLSAHGYLLLGFVSLGRSSLDEASELFRKAAAIHERLGLTKQSDKLRRLAAEVSPSSTLGQDVLDRARCAPEGGEPGEPGD